MRARDVRTVDPAEAETATALVCVRVQGHTLPPESDKSPWADYQRMVTARSSIESCSLCDAPVYVDSISPKTPPKVCIECVGDIIANEGAPKQ